MNICSIDPGSKNFAICIENVSYEKLKLLNCPKKNERYISDGIRQDTKNKKDILIPSLKYKEFLNEVILCSKTVICENIDITMGEKMKNSKLKRQLGIVENKYNGSDELISNYKEMYNLDYLNNFALIVGILVLGAMLSKKFLAREPVV